MTAALNLLITIAGIGLLMIVHESGHYFAARWTGMRVIRFSIGFGPVLFRKQLTKQSTVFQVALVPFLAYVQIAGMNPFEENEPDDPGLFDKKSVFARMFVIFAGPLANYLLACLLMFGVALSGPVPASDVVVVSEVMADSAALAGGVRVGDRIEKVAGTPVRSIEQVQALTAPRANQPTEYAVRRDGQLVSLTITPRPAGSSGRIGVALTPLMRQLGFAEAARFGLVQPIALSGAMLSEIGRAFRQRTTENFGGIVQMGHESMKQAERGARPFIAFISAISVSLGFFNLLPFPALDGGRLVFLFLEVVFRRKVNAKIEATVNGLGMLTLLTLMVLVTFRDIARMMQ